MSVLDCDTNISNKCLVQNILIRYFSTKCLFRWANKNTSICNLMDFINENDWDWFIANQKKVHIYLLCDWQETLIYIHKSHNNTRSIPPWYIKYAEYGSGRAITLYEIIKRLNKYDSI